MVTDGVKSNVLLRLLEISRELTGANNIDEVLGRVMDGAVEVTGAERGFLCLKREGELDIAVARNLDHEEIGNARKKLSRSIIQRVLKTGEPLVSNDAKFDERLSDSTSVHQMKLRSVACIPLKVLPKEIGRGVGGATTIIGVVYLDHRFEVDCFADTNMQFLEIFGAHAALAIRNAQLLQMARGRNEQLSAQLEESARELLRTRSLLKDVLADSSEQHHLPGFVYASRKMHEVLGLVVRVADSELPILVSGESGTGKEQLAQAIHQLSRRREGPFIAVNCGSIPAELFESELFGHRKGSFTGAERDREGLIMKAHGGTLFLDEIGELPQPQQVKLLRVLQERYVRRVGDDVPRPVDFRVLSATNKNLEQEVRDSHFREDLYYRLRVFNVELPPLRERREDVPLLVDFFIGQFGDPATQVVVDPEAYTLLASYDWPGNIRELQNEVRRALALAAGYITPAELSPEICQSPKRPNALALIRQGNRSLEDILAVVEREVLRETLSQYKGNKSKTAQHLGISRNGLAMKMERLGLE